MSGASRRGSGPRSCGAWRAGSISSSSPKRGATGWASSPRSSVGAAGGRGRRRAGAGPAPRSAAADPVDGCRLVAEAARAVGGGGAQLGPRFDPGEPRVPAGEPLAVAHRPQHERRQRRSRRPGAAAPRDPRAPTSRRAGRAGSGGASGASRASGPSAASRVLRSCSASPRSHARVRQRPQAGWRTPRAGARRPRPAAAATERPRPPAARRARPPVAGPPPGPPARCGSSRPPAPAPPRPARPRPRAAARGRGAGAAREEELPRHRSRTGAADLSQRAGRRREQPVAPQPVAGVHQARSDIVRGVPQPLRERGASGGWRGRRSGRRRTPGPTRRPPPPSQRQREDEALHRVQARARAPPSRSRRAPARPPVRIGGAAIRSDRQAAVASAGEEARFRVVAHQVRAPRRAGPRTAGAVAPRSSGLPASEARSCQSQQTSRRSRSVTCRSQYAAHGVLYLQPRRTAEATAWPRVSSRARPGLACSRRP